MSAPTMDLADARRAAADAMDKARLNEGGNLVARYVGWSCYCGAGAVAKAAGANDRLLADIDAHTDDAHDVARVLLAQVPALSETYALDVDRLHAAILAFDNGGSEDERTAAFLDAAYGRADA